MFGKILTEIGDLIYYHDLANLRFDANLFFYQKLLWNHCLHDLRLYIQKMMTKREMVNF